MQPRALKRLNLFDRDEDYLDYCYQESYPTCRRVASKRRVGCNGNQYVTYIWNTPVQSRGVGRENLCFENGTALDSWGPLGEDDFKTPIIIASFDSAVIDAFLNLKFLQAANIYVDSLKAGVLPLQLARLTDMKHLVIRYSCMTGTLPTAWRWRKLSTLVVGAIEDSPDFAQTPVSSTCGIQGPLPSSWPTRMPQVRHLYLVNNHLRGTLPQSWSNWKALSDVWLSHNHLSGSIPAGYANWGVSSLSLNSNMLSGSLPSFGTDTAPSRIQQSLTYMDLSNNAFTGKHHGAHATAARSLSHMRLS